jgi:Ca-activated chloride channel family protein
MMAELHGLTFLHPLWLLLLLGIPVWVWFIFFKKSTAEKGFLISDLSSIPGSSGWRLTVYKYLPLLFIASMAFCILALARPRKPLTETEIKTEGIDIMMVMDLSSSMLSQDFDPDRLEVSKRVAVEFIEARANDRIGLVVFAGEAFTQCPLTSDHKVLSVFFENLRVGQLEDGTAIGMGLATAVNRIKDSKATSRVIILLTDGVNNSGYIDPETATQLAEHYKLKVYTIGVGTDGYAPSPIGRNSNGAYVFGLAEVKIDTMLLRDIARRTGGRYFRATDSESLKEIYREIDALEKTEIETAAFQRYTELFRIFLIPGIMLLILWLLLSEAFFKPIT